MIKPVVIAVFSSIFMTLLINYWVFINYLQPLQDHQQQLQKNLSSDFQEQQAQQQEQQVQQQQTLGEQATILQNLETQLSTLTEQLLIQQRDQQANSLRTDTLQKLTDNMSRDLQDVVKHHDRLIAQIDKTHAAVQNVINALQQKEQSIKQLLPVGTIVLFPKQLIVDQRDQWLESGWLVCDGSDYPVASYPELAALLLQDETHETFQVPNLNDSSTSFTYLIRF